MKFLVDNWPLILLALVSGGMLLWPVLKRGAGGPTAVSATEAVRLINREKAVLVDVSTADEYAGGHAAGARHLPLAELDQAKGLPANKALPVVLLCPTGARAGRAAATLRKAGWENAVSVQGGTAAWREAQLPVEKGDAAERTEKADRSDKGGKAEKHADKGAEKGAEKSA